VSEKQRKRLVESKRLEVTSVLRIIIIIIIIIITIILII
jgi:hypothetical protein